MSGQTTDGKPKVIDVVDASGGDDIDTSLVVTVEPNSDGEYTVIGLTGRKLQLGKRNNPTHLWHLGYKLVFDASFPKPLIDRVKGERAKKRARSAKVADV